MAKAAKALKRRAVEVEFNQLRLDFLSAGIKNKPIYPYGCLKNEQPFFSNLRKNKTVSKTIGPDDEMTAFLITTINKGVTLMRTLILHEEMNFLEVKSVTNIITTYLPERSRQNSELKTTPLWGKFARNLSRSNRRTSMYRLSMAAQEMGNELPALAKSCDRLINKIYKLIKEETGKIFDACDRAEWAAGLENKPTKYIRVGSQFHTKL